ncbi:hypothetical protein LCGC14_1911590, partial [marine sediment metagenome]
MREVLTVRRLTVKALQLTGFDGLYGKRYTGEKALSDGGKELLYDHVSAALLDDPELARLTTMTGENIRPAQGFQVIATSNEGIDRLDPALGDRFEAVLTVTHPHPKLVDRLNGLIAGLGDVVHDSYFDDVPI